MGLFCVWVWVILVLSWVNGFEWCRIVRNDFWLFCGVCWCFFGKDINICFKNNCKKCGIFMWFIFGYVCCMLIFYSIWKCCICVVWWLMFFVDLFVMIDIVSVLVFVLLFSFYYRFVFFVCVFVCYKKMRWVVCGGVLCM